MEVVQDAVKDRRQQQTAADQQEKPAVNRIEGGENFGLGVLQAADRPHPAQNHRGIEEGIKPAHAFSEVVAKNAQQQGENGGNQGDRAMPPQALAERLNGQNGMMFFLVHVGAA
jgi:hypothetical protein